MTAVDNFIANLQQQRYTAGNGPVVGDVDLFVAALQELAGGAVSGGSIVAPQGRLTLTSGVSYLTTDVTGALTVFYTPAVGNQIPIFDGVSAFAMSTFAELSQTLADATKSPAAAVANSNYDLFVWSNAGVITLSRGPKWTSDTARGAGAGTTELTLLNGFNVNANAIANGPAANLGTYVGTIRTDATPACNMMFLPAAAAGGSINRLDVWNAFNRADVITVNRDSTLSWTYNSTVLRAKDNNANNSTKFIVGLAGDGFLALNRMRGFHSSGAGTFIGWGLDSTTVLAPGAAGTSWNSSGVGTGQTNTCQYGAMAPLGFHFVCPLESAESATSTFDNADTLAGLQQHCATTFKLRM